MPIYEYECEKCGAHAEYLQSMSEAPKTTCEKCGGALHRVISPSGFILKGGGWYKDLYSKPKGGSGGSSSGSGSGGGGDKKD
jgi:putative FmdB family regulatory protein